MIVYRSVRDVPADFGPSAVAIGKFDGVHLGHRRVIERLRQRADESGSASVAVTFDRNPLALLRPDRCPDDVIAVERKVELLGELGLDVALLLAFDDQLAGCTAEEFVTDILVGVLRASVVLVGADFRFGAGGVGTPELLRELGEIYGFTVEIVGDVYLEGFDRRVSSTWIRELLLLGDVATAARVLGRDVEVRGEVVHGLKRGRELGFPTANLSANVDSFVPADGVYAGWLIDHDSGAQHRAAISVGTNPTFDDVPERQIEAHALGETELELYGHDVTVSFVQRLRGMVAFEGVDRLKTQIADDIAEAHRVLRVVS